MPLPALAYPHRYGVGILASSMPVIESEIPVKKTFEEHEPGYLHVAIEYLPQMPDERHPRYLFVVIIRPCGQPPKRRCNLDFIAAFNQAL